MKMGFRTLIEIMENVFFVSSLFLRIKKRIRIIPAPQNTEKERTEVRVVPKICVQKLSELK